MKKLRDEFSQEYPEKPWTEFPDYVSSRAEQIIHDILENEITINTTLWFSEVVGFQAFDLQTQLSSIELEYANPAMIEGSPYVSAVGWLPGRNAFEVEEPIDQERRVRIEQYWAAYSEAHRVLFRSMVPAGVTFVAGTDATTHLVVPGFSIHDELISLVRNGMTPAESLRSATAIPAKMIGSDAGVIEPGRAADLVLLSENPLDDISNTKSIEAVVVRGRIYERDKLEGMLAGVLSANASSRNRDISAYISR